MSQTQELEESVSTEIDESTNTEASKQSDDVPSWSEIFSRSSDIGIKKSVLAYALGAGALFAGSMFFLPVTVGFTASLLVVSLITGFVGKADLAGAGITGLLGGGVASILTAGLAALTIAPIISGAATGLIAGVAGVLIGGFVRSRIGGSDD